MKCTAAAEGGRPPGPHGGLDSRVDGVTKEAVAWPRQPHHAAVRGAGMDTDADLTGRKQRVGKPVFHIVVLCWQEILPAAQLRRARRACLLGQNACTEPARVSPAPPAHRP